MFTIAKLLKFSAPAMLVIAIAAGCNSSETKLNLNDYSQNFPLEVPEENSLLASWAQKEVLSSKVLDDMETPSNWSISGIAEMSYTKENKYEGKQALRYHTSMLDSLHIQAPSERSPWGSFGGQQGGDANMVLKFDKPQDWSEFNRISIWVYIHPSQNPNIHFFLGLKNQGTPEETLNPRHDTNYVIEQGKWVNVLWEIEYLERDKVSEFSIFQTLIGYDRDMGEQYVTIDFDRLELQKVAPDNYTGWNIPDGKFAFSHVGYRPTDKKIALAKANDAEEFSILDAEGNVCFTGKATKISSKGNDFSSLDFSDFSENGVYTISYAGKQSKPFPINEDTWLGPMMGALNFFFCQRCGYEVPGIHSVCHQDWQGFYEDEIKPINGGWHDAGDMSQGFYRTAFGAYSIMRNLINVREEPKLADLQKKLEDEAAWGIDWLVKTRFHDGRHIDWARQRIYSDNIIGTYDDVVIAASFIKWENFFSAADFLMAAELLPSYAEKKAEMLAMAEEEWNYAMEAGGDWERINLQEASWGAIASAKLYKATSDPKYREAAIKFGKLLIDCQERGFKGGIPISGYFYNDTRRERLVHCNHGAFSETPLLAFSELCHTFPEAKEWIDWFAGSAIYNEYYSKAGSRISAPYDLVPNGVFRRADEAAAARPGQKNYNLIQYEYGTQLNEDYALRTFPIWGGELFHGGTACHLSTSWAASEAASLVNDKDGIDLVQEQLEWTLGRNPFSQSFMYGVGYDFAPYFVYCTKNIVGALPVGIDSFKDDEPYWHGSAYATSKEIWICPVSRFMGTLASFLGSKPETSEVSVILEKTEGKTIAHLSGKGNHKISIELYNASSDFTEQTVELGEGGQKDIIINLTPVNDNEAHLAAVIIDSDKTSAKVATL